MELKITSAHAFEQKWRMFCLPVVDGTKSVELKITPSAHALKKKWRLFCLPVEDGT